MKFIISIDDIDNDAEDKLCNMLCGLNLELEKHVVRDTLFMSAVPAIETTAGDAIEASVEMPEPEYVEKEPAMDPVPEPAISSHPDCMILNFSTICPIKTVVDSVLQNSKLCVSTCNVAEDIVCLEINGLMHKCPSVKLHTDCMNVTSLLGPSSIRALVKFVDSDITYPCVLAVEQSPNAPCLMIGSDLINMIKREEVSSNVNVSREQY